MTSNDIILAQLGCGYWGPNLLRNFSAQPGCHVKWVADPVCQRRDFVTERFPRTSCTAEWQTVLQDTQVQAVIVSTPATTHFELAEAFLQAGKDVFVEKPMAMAAAQADQLVTLAESVDRILMVGHTFLYNPAVRYMKQLKDARAFGETFYLYCQRLNLGQVRPDINAWWSLAPHDVSILLYLMDGELPACVSCHGVDYIQPGVEDVVFATLKWDNGVSAHVHVSWLDPGKVRKVTLVGSRKMVVYDDVSADKITILDKGVDILPRIGDRMDYDQPPIGRIIHRTGDTLIPKIEFVEPLYVEASHFIDCVRTRRVPLTGARHGRDVVAVLETGATSLRTGAPAQVSDRCTIGTNPALETKEVAA